MCTDRSTNSATNTTPAELLAISKALLGRKNTDLTLHSILTNVRSTTRIIESPSETVMHGRFEMSSRPLRRILHHRITSYDETLSNETKWAALLTKPIAVYRPSGRRSCTKFSRGQCDSTMTPSKLTHGRNSNHATRKAFLGQRLLSACSALRLRSLRPTALSLASKKFAIVVSVGSRRLPTFPLSVKTLSNSVYASGKLLPPTSSTCKMST